MVEKRAHPNEEYITGVIDAIFDVYTYNCSPQTPQYLHDYKVSFKPHDNGYTRVFIHYSIEGVCTKEAYFEFRKETSMREFISKAEIIIEQICDHVWHIVKDPKPHIEND